MISERPKAWEEVSPIKGALLMGASVAIVWYLMLSIVLGISQLVLPSFCKTRWDFMYVCWLSSWFICAVAASLVGCFPLARRLLGHSVPEAFSAGIVGWLLGVFLMLSQPIGGYFIGFLRVVFGSLFYVFFWIPSSAEMYQGGMMAGATFVVPAMLVCNALAFHRSLERGGRRPGTDHA